MADVKWIKITTDIFDDEKILLIESLPDAYAIIVVWFKLLCLAGKQNNSGVFIMNDKIAYTDKMLATIFRMKETTVQLALKTFEDFGMIEIVDGVITIPNWGKHQNLDQLENKKQYMKNYMANYREKQKQLSCKSNSKTNSKTNVNQADIEEEKEEERELDLNKELNIDSNKNIESGAKTKRFCKPTLEETENYINENNLNVNARYWYDYYESNGWKVGRNPMKDWKACIRRWNRTEMSDLKNNRKEEQLKITAFDV